MREYSHGDLVFDVDDSGPAEASAVVLLHGYPENRTCWHAVTRPLVDAGLRILAPDQRGYSPRARPAGRRAYRMDLLVEDVVALLDAAGIDRAHVVGHDWGGAVAWAMAERHPGRVRTVTSLTTPHPRAMLRAALTGPQALRSWYMAMFQLPFVPELAYRPALKGRLRATLERSGLPREAVDRYVRPLQEPGAATAALNWYRAIPWSLVHGSRGTVECPVTFVYGARDEFVSRKAADLTRRYVAGPYRFEVLDDVGHWVPEQVPDVVARLVLDRVG